VPAGSPVPPRPVRPATLHELPVLVVDDNATNRRILEEMLTNWRMRPLAVAEGRSALAALRRTVAAGTPFQLVLLDGHMPEMDGFSLAEHIQQAPELRGIAIVMLTSAGEPGDVARCRDLGISASLMKPVKQSELLDAILTALGRSLQEPPPRPAAPRPAPAGGRPLRVLLAEDHPVNQRLAVRLLEKQGHAVVVANNGREALAALEREPFDLVLMDVQMPELDGLEATAQLRRQERGTSRHVPVIAMTAHAMTGDRERCLAAGMDGYVSKPIRAEELLEALAGVALPPAAAPPAGPAAGAPREAEVFDKDEALQRVGGDVDLLRELVEVFLESCPGQLRELREAAAAGDPERMRRTAHAIKGAVSNFGARLAVEAAQRLETMDRDGVASAAQTCAALEDRLARLQLTLAAFAEGVASGR
jgi:CheY-like chemotaxis protein/HPt (histidine-containing phosphotransfer) domain-containing protein